MAPLPISLQPAHCTRAASAKPGMNKGKNRFAIYNRAIIEMWLTRAAGTAAAPPSMQWRRHCQHGGVQAPPAPFRHHIVAWASSTVALRCSSPRRVGCQGKAGALTWRVRAIARDAACGQQARPSPSRMQSVDCKYQTVIQAAPLLPIGCPGLCPRLPPAPDRRQLPASAILSLPQRARQPASDLFGRV